MIKRTLNLIGQSIEELILLGIIILNIFDFFEIITPDWDYVKKIVSLTALGYLMYKADLTRLFFGVRNKAYDTLILLAYFMLSFKNIIGNSMSAIEELTHKGIEYWGNLVLVQRASGTVINVTSSINDFELANLEALPLESSLNSLTRSLTIIPEFPPRINDIFLKVTNDLGTVFYRIDTKFFIHRWHNFLIDNISFIQTLTVLIGFFLIVLLSFYFARKIQIQSPSIMQIIEEEEATQSLGGYLVRVLIIFAIINFFFIAVFNLTLEWLAIAVDSPILIIAIFFYLLIWMKHHKKFSTDGLIFKIGNGGEAFYERFINLFYTKNGLLLALSGMLVLHMLTDIGNFIVPYITGLKDPLYFAGLGPGHTQLLGFDKVGLFFTDYAMAFGRNEQVALIFVYLLNIIGTLMLFTGPGVLWFYAFSQKKLIIGKVVLTIFYSAITAILLAPLFRIGRISSGQLVGVDVTTHSVFEILKVSLVGAVVVCVGVALFVFFLSLFRKIRIALRVGSVLIIFMYFGQYIYHFFIDTSKYYVNAITLGIHNGDILLPGYFLIFLTLTIVFYTGGFLSFIYELLTQKN